MFGQHPVNNVEPVKHEVAHATLLISMVTVQENRFQRD